MLSRRAWLVALCGPRQDLLGWAQPLDSGEPGGGWQSMGAPSKLHLKQQLGAGDQPGRKEMAVELLVFGSGRGGAGEGGAGEGTGSVGEPWQTLPVSWQG